MKKYLKLLGLLLVLSLFIMGQAGCPGCMDTTKPNVAITYPANNSTVSGTVTIRATATDNVGVVKVEFYIDNNKVGEDTSSPYEYSWNTDNLQYNSTHTIQAKAYDNAGNVGESPIITVTIGDSNAPEVVITNPTDGSTVSGTVLIQTQVTERSKKTKAPSGIAKVEFYIDNNKVGEDTSSPYEYSWDTTQYTSGTHTITAKAYDNAGNVGESPAVTVYIPVRVLILNNNAPGSYFFGYLCNSYQEAYDCLSKVPFILPAVVTDDEISSNPSILNNYDVLVLPDTVPGDDTLEAVKNWYNSGKGIVATDSAACFLNYAIFTPGDNGRESWWDYITNSIKITDTSHYITRDYPAGWENSALNTYSGDEAYYFKDVISSVPGMTILAQQLDDETKIAVFAYDGGGNKRIVFVGPNDFFDPQLDALMIRACMWAGRCELDVPITLGRRTPSIKPGVSNKTGR